MAWTIEYTEPAEKTLSKLDRTVARRIVAFLDQRIAVTDDPRSQGQALSGALRGQWRYRVGDYRIICRIEDQRLVVLVIDIGHRGDVYR